MQRIFATVTAVAMLVGASGAAFAQTGNADFTLTPLGNSQWELSVVVSGDTSGLSAFNLDVNGTFSEVNATDFEFRGILADGSVNPNVAGIAGIRGDNFSPGGFQTILSGLIGDEPPGSSMLYNAAASQALTSNGAIFGVGQMDIEILNAVIPPANSNDISFGARAVLGILTTPANIIAGSSQGAVTLGPISVDAGLYAPGNGSEEFLPDSLVSLTIIPEPASLALLGLGGLMIFRRR